MIGRLNHIAIAVPDLEEAIKIYRDTLGAKEADAKARIETINTRLSQLVLDLDREAALNSDAVETIKSLEWEADQLEKASKGHDQQLFVSACQFVGLLNEDYENWQQYKKDKASINENDILNKIELRNKARKNKDYEEADRIRNELLDKGVLIEDKDGKTIWKFK